MLTTEESTTPCDVCGEWTRISSMNYILHQDLSLCDHCDTKRKADPKQFASKLNAKRESRPTKV